MLTRLYIVATFAALLIVATGCDSSTVGPPLTVDTTVVSKANLRADSTIGWLYYSIDADSVVSPSLANTAEWDIRMAYLKCCGNTRTITVQLNSGNAGVGSVRGGVVKSRFEQVAQLPADVALRSDDTLNPVVSFIGASGVWIYAGAPNHTLSPSPDRCIVIETSKGRRVKFQFTSIYEGSPVTPTQNSPIGFYHFRYANLR
jgi:hypothetical protein